MAITFVAAARDTFSTVPSFPGPIPAGVQDGDLLLFFVTTDTAHDSTGTPPTDVTKVGEQDNGTDNTLSVFRKIAASEGSSITFTNIFAANEVGLVITLAYRGVDQTTPMDATAVFGTESTTAWDTGSITPVTNGAWLVGCFACDPGSDPYTFAWDSPTVERIDSDTTPSGQFGTSAYLAIGDEAIATAGSPESLGGDSSVSDSAATVILALRPAATGGDIPLDAQDEAFAVTGVEATIIAARMVAADVAAFVLTGAAATLAAGRVVAADPASYAVTGTDATLAKGYAFSSDPGTYTVDGTNATLVTTRLVSGDPGTYAVTGTDANLLLETPGAYTVNAASGTYTVTGVNASTVADYMVEAEFGEYVVTGYSLGFGQAVLPILPAGETGYIADYGRGRIVEPVTV